MTTPLGPIGRLWLFPTDALTTKVTVFGDEDDGGYRVSAARDGVVATFAPPRARPVVVRVALLSASLFVALALGRRVIGGSVSTAAVLGTLALAMGYGLVGAALHAWSLRTTFPVATSLWQADGSWWIRGDGGKRTELGAVWALAVRPVPQASGPLFELAFLGEEAEVIVARGPLRVMEPALHRLARRLGCVVDGDVARPPRPRAAVRVPDPPADEADARGAAPRRRRARRDRQTGPA